VIIDLRELEEGFTDLEFDESPEELHIEDESFDFSGPVNTRLSFYSLGESLSVKGHSQARVAMDCVRCLERTEISLETRFKFVFQKDRPKNVSDGDDDSLIWLDAKGEKIDLGEEIKDYVLLEIPQNPVCSDTCAGLCPTCGENLNTTICSCKEESVDPRWEALRAIKD
jgi:uncharacterized protein